MKTQKTKLKRAVVYARFSSDMQRTESIDAQVRAATEYASRNDMVIVGEYIDKAKSATNDNRPEFQSMIADAKRGRFDIVLVHKFDRFARNRSDSIGYRMELRRHGVRLVSVLEYIDEGSPESIILESVLEGMAEYYSKNLAREVEKGKRENALKAMHVGGVPPLGYDVDRSTMKLVINEREAEAVKLIFRLTLDGYGYSHIVDELHRLGFRTKAGTAFSKTSLHHILKNEKYAGVYIYSKSAPKDIDGKRNGHAYKDDEDIIRIEDGVPAIVSKKDFAKVRQALESRKHKSGRMHAIQTYLLSGKIECGCCKGSYTRNYQRAYADHKEFISYKCSKKSGKVKCKNGTIRRDSLEAFVLEKLADYVYDDRMIPKLIAEYEHYLLNRDKDAVSAREALKKRLHGIDKEIGNIVSVIAKTASDALVSRLNALEAEKKEIEYRVAKLFENTGVQTISEAKIKTAFKRARQLLSTGELKSTKVIIERYVEKVVIYEDKIELMLNFDFNLQKESSLNPARQKTDSGSTAPRVSRGNDVRC